MNSALVAAAGLVLTVTACGGGSARGGASGERLQVVATTTIVADVVRRVGGDDVAVTALMGAGIDPHLYKASAGDVRTMAAADAIFYNGLHLEGKMADLLERMRHRGAVTVAVAECLPGDRLITSPGFVDTHDPHVWFDVALWSEVSYCVAETLGGLDAERGDAYRVRATAYAAELLALDAEVRQRLAGIPAEHRVLVTAHDAFAYFGRAYALEVRGLLGVSTAAEAGAGDVQELASFIAERRLPAIFVETSVAPRYIQAVKEAVAARGHPVAIGGSLYSDALGSAGTPAETYVGTVRANVETIAAALAVSAQGGS